MRLFKSKKNSTKADPEIADSAAISPEIESETAPDKGKKQHQKKDFQIFLKRLLLLAGALFLLLSVAGISVFYVLEDRKRDAAEEPLQAGETYPESPIEEIPDVTPADESFADSVFGFIIQAGEAVADALERRPRSYELTDENRSTFAAIESCLIQGDTGKVEIKATAEGLPKSDDKFYYLFALNTFDDAISESDEFIVREYKDEEISFDINLNYNQANSRLYKKFVVAVKLNGAYVPVSRGGFITNPEVIAKHSQPYQEARSKKGILVDPNRLRGSELDDLGVKQAAYNIPVGRLLGQTTSPHYPTVYYQYNGKSYAFNGQVVAEYDLVFSTLTAKGIQTTAIILNNYNGAYTQLIHPLARSGSTAPYYAFNGTDADGVEYMAAIGSFLADRYSGSAHGRISNWVIANEINARKEWNYMQKVDTATYVEEFEKAFRVFYNAIRSVNAASRVYISLDQQWDRDLKNNPNYDARDILDEFNRITVEKGNIDWGLAQHPYSVPLTNSRFWNSSKYVNNTASTSMMTMGNISVLTNYMQQEQLLTTSGEVRSILISELGYTSDSGEALQAAAFAYAYYIIESNPHIDGFLLNRQTDAAEEVAQGLSFGLNNAGGGQKQIYNVFKYIDTSEHTKYTEFAKSIIGISSWSEVVGRQ